MKGHKGSKAASNRQAHDDPGQPEAERLAPGSGALGRLCQEGLEVDAILVVHSSPTSLYLQSCSNGPWLESLGARLSAHAAATLPLSSTFCARPQIRTKLYCVKWVDGLFYRAVVLGETSGNLRRHCYDVKYVDYGNSGVATLGDIYELPQDILTVPAQALHCCLLGLSPFSKDPGSKAAVDSAWQKVLFELKCSESSLFKATLVKKCSLNPVDEQEELLDPLWLISLTHSGLSLNQMVLKEARVPLQAGFEDPPTFKSRENSSLETIDRDVVDRDKVEDEDNDDNRPPTPVPQLLQESCKAKVNQWLLDLAAHGDSNDNPLLSKRTDTSLQKEILLKSMYQEIEPKCVRPKVKVPLENVEGDNEEGEDLTRCTFCCTHDASPDKFYVQLHDHIEEYSDFNRQLTQATEAAEAFFVRNFDEKMWLDELRGGASNVKSGHPRAVVARIKLMGIAYIWTRGQILSVSPQETPNKRQPAEKKLKVVVFLVDLGTVYEVDDPYKDLRPLPSSETVFLQHPRFAVCCSLMGLKPAGAACNYLTAASLEFRRLIDKVKDAILMGPDEQATTKGTSYKVVLILESVPKDQDGEEDLVVVNKTLLDRCPDVIENSDESYLELLEVTKGGNHGQHSQGVINEEDEPCNPMEQDFLSLMDNRGFQMDEDQEYVRGQPQVCKLFRNNNGHCFRGANCKFLHDLSSESYSYNGNDGSDEVLEKDDTDDHSDFVTVSVKADEELRLPAVGAVVAVQVIVINHPSVFYLQLIFGDLDMARPDAKERFELTQKGTSSMATKSSRAHRSGEDLADLCQSLNSHCRRMVESHPSYATSIRHGELVAVRYSDDCWYRARVLASFDCNTKVNVWFVDFGHSHVTENSHANMQRLGRRFLKLPFQAVECYLDGLEPAPTDSNDTGFPVWSDQAKQALTNAVGGRNASTFPILLARVCSLEDYPVGRLGVELYRPKALDTGGLDALNIGDSLVDLGVARRIDKGGRQKR